MDVKASTTAKAVPFKSPKRFLAGLDPQTTANVIASAADIALIVDDGVIKDIALGSEHLMREGYGGRWRGMRWADTVTIESKPKVEDLLKSATSRFGAWREINHPAGVGSDLPVRYAAVQTGEKDRILIIGRDLRSISSLQQRLVEAHQELERDYARLREADARYHLLFQSVDEGVLIVDADSLIVEAANPAALERFNATNAGLVGANFASLFPKKTARPIERAVAEALNQGVANIVDVALPGANDPAGISLSAFRYEGDRRLIIRLGANEVFAAKRAASGFQAVIEKLPDGLIVAGGDLRILSVNQAAIDMARVVGRGQIVGERLAKFLGRSGTDLNVLITTLKNHGSVRNFKTVLRDRFGAEEDIEVSAVSAPFEDSEAYGFSVRGVAKRLANGPSISEKLPSSVDELTGLVGRVPLKDIVRDATELIEKLCIESALESTGDNRASAAEMLGLSRQGLYSKLKRFGIDD